MNARFWSKIDVMKNTRIRKATSDPSNIPWLHKKTMHYPQATHHE